MAKKYDFDYIIIGSGPAGRTIAKRLVGAKKHIAIVDYDEFGGAEINTRDLPYKINLDFAHAYHELTNHPAIGNSSFHFNFPTLIANSERIIKNTRFKLQADYANLGITIITGFANFLDNHTIAIDENRYTAENFIIATGSDLKVNEISGLDGVKFFTPDTIFEAHRLPEFAFVVGGGPTGVEIAEYLAMLGTTVIIMERGPQLLPREDEDISKLITEYFTKDLDIKVMPNAKVVGITEDYNSKIVIFTDGTGEKMVRVDSIILATGSEPILDFGLENAGVEYKKTGITVDKYFNTSAKNIYAIGDCIGCDNSSTERATHDANILAENLLHRGKTTEKFQGVARTIGTCQEVAITGLNERDATARDINYKKSITSLGKNNYVKILTDRSGRTIGTTVVAKDASFAFKLHKLLTK